jgi:hypothetical protein
MKKGISIPRNPPLVMAEGFVIDRTDYKNHDEIKLTYALADETHKREVYAG